MARGIQEERGNMALDDFNAGGRQTVVADAGRGIGRGIALAPAADVSLLSSAASYATGRAIVVDGGTSLL